MAVILSRTETTHAKHLVFCLAQHVPSLDGGHYHNYEAKSLNTPFSLFSPQGAAMAAAGGWTLAARAAVLVNKASAATELSSQKGWTCSCPALTREGTISRKKPFSIYLRFPPLVLWKNRLRHRARPETLTCSLQGSQQADAAQSLWSSTVLLLMAAGVRPCHHSCLPLLSTS